MRQVYFLGLFAVGITACVPTHIYAEETAPINLTKTNEAVSHGSLKNGDWKWRETVDFKVDK